MDRIRQFLVENGAAFGVFAVLAAFATLYMYNHSFIGSEDESQIALALKVYDKVSEEIADLKTPDYSAMGLRFDDNMPGAFRYFIAFRNNEGEIREELITFVSLKQLTAANVDERATVTAKLVHDAFEEKLLAIERGEIMRPEDVINDNETTEKESIILVAIRTALMKRNEEIMSARSAYPRLSAIMYDLLVLNGEKTLVFDAIILQENGAHFSYHVARIPMDELYKISEPELDATASLFFRELGAFLEKRYKEL